MKPLVPLVALAALVGCGDDVVTAAPTPCETDLACSRSERCSNGVCVAAEVFGEASGDAGSCLALVEPGPNGMGARCDDFCPAPLGCGFAPSGERLCTRGCLVDADCGDPAWGCQSQLPEARRTCFPWLCGEGDGPENLQCAEEILDAAGGIGVACGADAPCPDPLVCGGGDVGPFGGRCMRQCVSDGDCLGWGCVDTPAGEKICFPPVCLAAMGADP